MQVSTLLVLQAGWVFRLEHSLLAPPPRGLAPPPRGSGVIAPKTEGKWETEEQWDAPAKARAAALVAHASDACTKAGCPTECSCVSAAVARRLGADKIVRDRDVLLALLQRPRAGDALEIHVVTELDGHRRRGHCWAMEHDGHCWIVYQSFLGCFGARVSRRPDIANDAWATAFRQLDVDSTPVWRLLHVEQFMLPKLPALHTRAYTNRTDPIKSI